MLRHLSVLCLALAAAVCAVNGDRTFVVDGDTFLKDGQPFQFISGEVHYYRIHPDYWHDRLSRMRAAGLNAIQVYIPWNIQEPFEGQFEFGGSSNVFRFLEIAQSYNLSVLLRPGPYIADEWEHGGFPYWLLKKEGIVFRHLNTPFLTAVENYFKVLFPKIKPYLYKNGGPIIMVAMENGYGAFNQPDQPYLIAIRDLFYQYLGEDIVYFTSDRSDLNAQTVGKIPGVLNSVTMSPTNESTVLANFALARSFSNNGPAICSEFYPGSGSKWGVPLGSVTPEKLVLIRTSCETMYNDSGSFSFYMFQGGTNFGFYNGQQIWGLFTTTYSDQAPLSEAGRPNPNYFVIRDWISTLSGWSHPPLPVPANNPIRAYGEVQVDRVHPLVKGLAKSFTQCGFGVQPLGFEEMDVPFGYVVYRTRLTVGGTTLAAPNIKDYGYIFLNGKQQSTFIQSNSSSTTITQANPGDELIIVVENLGRLSSLPIFESKGLFDNVTLDGVVLHNWFQCGIDFKRLPTLTYLDHLAQHIFGYGGTNNTDTSGVYFGSFTISGAIQDTFIHPRGFKKGQFFINGFNLGRYWDLGPQVTLYVPAPILKRHNKVVVVELLGNTDESTDKVIEFVSTSVWK